MVDYPSEAHRKINNDFICVKVNCKILQVFKIKEKVVMWFSLQKVNILLGNLFFVWKFIFAVNLAIYTRGFFQYCKILSMLKELKIHT